MKHKLGELKKYLPKGYGRLFAQQYGCSISKVYKVANGQLKDVRMIETMKNMAQKNYELFCDIEKFNKAKK